MSDQHESPFPQDTFKEHSTNWGTVTLEHNDGTIFIHFADDSQFPFELPETNPNYGFYDGYIAISTEGHKPEDVIERVKTIIDLSLARGQEQGMMGNEVQERISDALEQTEFEAKWYDIDGLIEG